MYGDPAAMFCVALVVPDRNKLYCLAERSGINFDEDASIPDMATNGKLKTALLKEICSHGLKNGLEKFELPGKWTNLILYFKFDNFLWFLFYI